MISKNQKIFFSILFAALILPINIALADVTADLRDRITLDSIPTIISTITGLIWKVFVGIAVVCFILAGIKFLTAQGDPEKIKEARRFVYWGAAGIVVAILGYSIVVIVRNALIPPA